MYIFHTCLNCLLTGSNYLWIGLDLVDPEFLYDAMDYDCWNFLMPIHVNSPMLADNNDSSRCVTQNWNYRTTRLYYNRAMHDDDNAVWCDFCNGN